MLLKKIFFAAFCTALLLILATNAAVRTFGGGYPSLFSPYHLPTKLEALGHLLLHTVAHPFIDGHTEAKTRDLIEETAKRRGLPPSFVLAIAQTESGLLPHRVSSAGAMGLMQLMPGTAEMYSVRDPFNSKDSVDGGTAMLSDLWKRYRGDRKRVAAAYNAGPGRVPRRGPMKNLPRETRNYIKKVLRAEAKLRNN